MAQAAQSQGGGDAARGRHPGCRGAAGGRPTPPAAPQTDLATKYRARSSRHFCQSTVLSYQREVRSTWQTQLSFPQERASCPAQAEAGSLPTCCHHGQAAGFVLRSPGLWQSGWKQRSDNFQQNQTACKQAGAKTSLEGVKIHHGCIHSWGRSHEKTHKARHHQEVSPTTVGAHHL